MIVLPSASSRLFDLLRCGQQVAFDPCGDQLYRITLGREPGLGQALVDPLRQLLGVDRPDLHELHLLAFDQGLAPLGLLRAAIKFGQADQQQGVVRRARTVFDQCRRALVAGLARWQAQLQHTLLREQRQAGTGLQQGAPVEVGVGAEHLAFVEPLLASRQAHRIGGFLAQQRVVATDHVDRCEVALQVFGQLGRCELHRTDRRGAEAPRSGSVGRQFQRRLLGLHLGHGVQLQAPGLRP